MPIQQMILADDALAVGTSYIITTGGNGAFFGYNNGVFGSVSPTPIVTPADPSHSLKIVECPASAPSFDFLVQGIVVSMSQSAFTQIQVEDSTGVVRTYTSASAGYTAGTDRKSVV